MDAKQFAEFVTAVTEAAVSYKETHTVHEGMLIVHLELDGREYVLALVPTRAGVTP